MPASRPIPAAAPHTPQRSDENFVFTAIAVFLVASLVLGVGAYQYMKHSQQQEQERTDRQAYKRYNDYLQSTDTSAPEPAATPAEPVHMQPAAAAQPSMAEKLLSHPAVTPGPGFNAPGVQETGVAIIDAIDHAQSSAKP